MRIELRDQALHLQGKINPENAEQVYQHGLAMFAKQQHPIVINLSQLENGSTLALAVLIRWLRQTPDAKGLIFQAVPKKMMNIIQACHLEKDLPIQ
jgi:phospholipid transport system transporter-binding protein